MSIDRVRSLLRDLDLELDGIEREITDLEDERNSLSDGVDRDDFEALVEDLDRLADSWMRHYYKNIDDDDIISKQYADQLLSIVKKYQ
jgi:hypothetical protein